MQQVKKNAHQTKLATTCRSRWSQRRHHRAQRHTRGHSKEREKHEEKQKERNNSTSTEVKSRKKPREREKGSAEPEEKPRRHHLQEHHNTVRPCIHKKVAGEEVVTRSAAHKRAADDMILCGPSFRPVRRRQGWETNVQTMSTAANPPHSASLGGRS